MHLNRVHYDYNPLVLNIDPHFQRDLQSWFVQKTSNFLSLGGKGGRKLMNITGLWPALKPYNPRDGNRGPRGPLAMSSHLSRWMWGRVGTKRYAGKWSLLICWWFVWALVWSNYSNLTRPHRPPKCSVFGREIPLWQRNLRGWSIILWPDWWWLVWIDFCCFSPERGRGLSRVNFALTDFGGIKLVDANMMQTIDIQYYLPSFGVSWMSSHNYFWAGVWMSRDGIYSEHVREISCIGGIPLHFPLLVGRGYPQIMHCYPCLSYS